LESFLTKEVYLQDVPLSTALSRLGYSVNGYILFGTEVLLNEAGEEPRITLNLFRADTVQTALDSIVRQLPDYRWVMVSDHLVNIFPVGQTKSDLLLRNTRKDILEIRIPQLDIKDQYPPNVIGNLRMFIPELFRELISENSPPGGLAAYGSSYSSSEGPQLSMSFKNLTVREILNGISEESIKSLSASKPPAGWIYKVTPDPKMYAGRTHSWSSLISVYETQWRAAVAARH
jgi:hypothetical protein